MQQPVEIDVEEDEQVVARVAGIDVAKASGTVCTRVPAESGTGRRVTKVWQVKADTRSLLELADHLVCQGVERVVLESTSDYWRAFFYILTARGLTVWLVNAAQVKNVPGRPKTDLLTELPERVCGLSAGGPVGVATLRPRDQRRGYAARSVNFGGGPARVA